ncbi:MAG: hypothetical protein NZ529_04790 [Cytophagaceae bacterium]|nr:hypothetical protein [Cytophagaceae bacterium]MDW8456093.1 choice-of-anchor Q domain-containing protein [Cytophagaceae bacterium]
MKLYKYLYIVFALCIAITSCNRKKDKLTSDPNALLSFSANKILFDTLFTSTGSVTKRLKVFNKNKNAVCITSVQLAGGSNSHFKIIVNGKSSSTFSDLILAGGDSLLVLISAWINPSDKELPYLVEDSIMFTTNGNLQSVLLQAYGQDAHFKTNAVISCNEVWKKGKPYLISGSLTVPQGCTLTIEKGTKIFCRKNASMQVYGTLLALGSKDSLILFSGDQLSKIYQNTPGQWTGIIFHSNSKNNFIQHTKIINAETALTIHRTDDADTLPELTIANSYILNMTKSALKAEATDVYVYNSVFSNTASYLLHCNGGNYYFYHNTFANFEYDYFRESAALYLSNISGALYCRSINTIVWGNRADEIQNQNTASANWGVAYRNCLLKTTSLPVGSGNLLNIDPKFENESKKDYRLKAGSPAVDAGIPMASISTDIEGKLRDYHPDVGAYEK